MIRSISLLCLIAAAGLAFPAAAYAAESAERPNVVVILVDDMGFSDIGCYGSEIPTPNLDALAAGGLRFTQFYNTGRCCPTRAALLTGLYSHQAGVGHMTGDYGVRGYRGCLNDNCITMGNVAHSAGYLAAIAGKWHVGHRDRSMYPLARGFDRFYGIPEGGGFYFQVKPGRTIVLNDEVVASTEKPLPEGWYSTDAWTENGLKFIDEAIEGRKPFFLYLAHNAPHFPLQATAVDIARFRGKYLAGWDKLSQERHARQIEMGLIDPKWGKAARPDDVRAWDSLSEEERDRFDHMMAAYAACVYAMDRSVGALVEGLKERGQFDNTLILFMSDNGGCAESGPKGKSIGDPTTAASNWFCGKSWAWMQDTPFRKFKHYNHEGGIATPLIAHWPKGISARGEWCRQPGHVIDILATLADVTGATYPTEKDGVPILPPEGRSLLPAFAGETIERDALYWEHEGNAAVRRGDWKLVRLGGKGPWELYDLKADRTEQHDLIDEKPEIAAELERAWSRWAERCHVSPQGLPKKVARRPPDKAMAPNEIAAGLVGHNRALYIKTGWIRDPYIHLAPDGYYYLTGTTPNPNDPREAADPYNKGLGIESIVGYHMQLWRSRDLADWEYLGTPYSLLDGYWAQHRPKAFESEDRTRWHLWAPEVHFLGGKWHLVHTSPAPVRRGSNLAVTQGDKIEGPYAFPLGDLSGGRHDPSLFQDDDGTVYLLWSNTMIAPLTRDLTGFAAEPVRIDPAGSRTGPDGKPISRIGHEGATMRKIGGKYVHFGTAWSTDRGRKGSYNLYYCTADEITGPYGPRRFAGRFLGHGTPFQDKAGKWWCTAFYNANVPPLARRKARDADLSDNAQTINEQGVTIVPLNVAVDDRGEVHIRAIDPDYANPGPDEAQEF